MDSLLQDLRYAFRMLLKNPGFTIVAVITLALGIGANTAIFSVVNGVLLRPLPLPEPDRLVFVYEDNRRQGWHEDVTSFETFTDWRNRSKSFQELAAFLHWSPSLTGIGEPEGLRGMLVTTRFFRVMGVEPMLGRTIVDGEDQRGRDGVTVLSHGYWQRRFGGDSSVIGREIRLNNTLHTVIGVMPPDFSFPGTQAELWVPLTTGPEPNPDRGNHYLNVIGRLKPGISVAEAGSEMEGIVRGLERQYPTIYAGFGATIVPLETSLTRSIRPALLVLAGSVFLVLLIACANVANLLLARGTARERELAIRTALGAGRWRLIRQMLTESVLLALLGGTLGLLFALWGIDLLVAMKPPHLPRIDDIAIDGTMLAFTLGLSVVTGIIFGLMPALRASAAGLGMRLKEGGRGMADGVRGTRLRRGLVVLEVALSLILLIGAGLLIRSFSHLVDVDPGFRTDELLTFRLVLPGEAGYSEIEARRAFMENFLGRLESIPGVKGAGGVLSLPFANLTNSAYPTIEGAPPTPVEELFEVRRNSISNNYFTLMGIPLKAGRFFTPADRDTSNPVVIINEAMARRFWPEGSPIGKRMKWGRAEEGGRWMEVVGVVGDVLYKGLDATPEPEVYMPNQLFPAPGIMFVVRTAGTPETMMPAIRRELRAVDPDLPIIGVRTMEDLLANSFADRRFTMLLLGIFAGIALLLASIGIYGLLAYSVAQRTREIGIRIALGAGRGDLLKMVLRQGLLLVVPGVILGAAIAAALTHLLSSLLFGVSATDPVTFALLSIVLVSVAMIACYIPALRATRVNPIVALRYEG